MKKPKILILGSNFAGLQVARHLRDHVKEEDVEITVVDRRNYLLFIPNIPLEIFEDRDPDKTQLLPLIPIYEKEGTKFIQAEVTKIDVDKKQVEVIPNERPGSAIETLCYDYLVVAVGNKLAYDKMEGFSEFGHSVTDTYLANKLHKYLVEEYKGGKIAIGSARFNQGSKGRLDFIPTALAACEGPPVELALSLAHWLEKHGKGSAKNITIFTPAELIAEDAGENNVHKLLEIASGMGFSYVNKTEDITRLTAEGIEFANGTKLEAELKIVLPDWEAHSFLRNLPITDEKGFVITDEYLKNPDYPEVYACGDAASATVPKIGSIGHYQSYIVANQIAKDLGFMNAEEADKEKYRPEVICYGDMGGGKAFYIHANTWYTYGGKTEILNMGRSYYDMKVQFRHAYFMSGGKLPYSMWKFGTWLGDDI